MKKIIILGSTGSIGTQALEVIRNNMGDYDVIGLSAHKDIELLLSQIDEFRPSFVAVSSKNSAGSLSEVLPKGVELFLGTNGPSQLASLDCDIVLNALVGFAGLDATIAALKIGRTLALANKESMVVAGEIINSLIAENSKSRILPVDSEHSAIFQCLLSEVKEEIERIIITASGGPFKGRKKEELFGITVDEALAHPKWRMGKKISIDSATMMNKGLEVIEAHHLFCVPYERIDVVIHPQSIIHSMVEFKDGSIKAHLSPADMRIPIQYAFTYPTRAHCALKRFDPLTGGPLTFEEVDIEAFPCLGYAKEAGILGKTFPVVLNAANEVAVDAFLNKKIAFLDISKVVYNVLNLHQPLDPLDLSALKEADRWARLRAQDEINHFGAFFDAK